jgi:NAD(P)-dependent dehydrogenase (short-subunit alcohol dehydrogenase family)
MINYDMKGKNAIVTGAASGLGLAIAEAFANAGANVAVVDLNQEKCNAVAKDL